MTTLFYISLGLYAFALLAQLAGVLAKKEGPKKLAWALFVLGLLAHIAYFAWRGVVAQRLPLSSQFEFSCGFALGVAPIVFMLIGIPLGIRTSRRESNIGVSISMGVMVLYYAFLIIAKSLAKKPEFFPHIIIWIPSVACLAIALLLIRRNQ